jgi:hypothetical protein
MAGAAGSAAGTITGITTTTAQPISDCSLTATFALGYSGNPGPHLITIAASQTASPPPDEVAMSIWVNSDMTSQLDDVASALASVGISGAIFSGVNTFTNYNVGRAASSPNLLWSGRSF